MRYFHPTLPTDSTPHRPVRGTLEPLEPPGRAVLARAWRHQRFATIALAIAAAILVLVMLALAKRLAHRDEVLPGV